MNKRIAGFAVIILLCVWAYFVFFKKNPNIVVGKNSDMVVIADVKKLRNYYMLQLMSNPAEWFSEKRKNQNIRKIKIENSGFVIPDYLAIYHLKNAPISQWYSILEIRDIQKVERFLQQEKFNKKSASFYQNDFFSVFIHRNKAFFISGKQNTSEITNPGTKSFANEDQLTTSSAKNYIHNSQASLTFLTSQKQQTFPITITNNSIKIGTLQNDFSFLQLLTNLRSSEHSFQLHLNDDGINKIEDFNDIFRNTAIFDSLSVQKISAVADLREVKEKIVSFEYDENFNEIEKTAYQNTLTPMYRLDIDVEDPQKTLRYFQKHHWMNEEDEFVKIPFQPNKVTVKDTTISIQSKTSNTKWKDFNGSENFVYFRNDKRLVNSFSSLSEGQRKWLSQFDSCLLVINGNEPYFYIQFKNAELPIILR